MCEEGRALFVRRSGARSLTHRLVNNILNTPHLITRIRRCQQLQIRATQRLVLCNELLHESPVTPPRRIQRWFPACDVGGDVVQEEAPGDGAEGLLGVVWVS